jgi:transposase-like protein
MGPAAGGASGAAPLDVFAGNGRLPDAKEEPQRLRRENAVLRQERDLFKHAAASFAAFFAKESQ